MLLILDAIDPDGEIRRFVAAFSTLEDSFDFLSSTVGKGNILLKASIKDGQQRYDLPVDAFDEIPLSVSLTTLQEEWQAILDKDYSEHLLHEDRLWLATQWVKQGLSKLEYHQRMVSWAAAGSRRNPYKTKANLAYYDEHLTYHQDQLARAECRLNIRANWLNYLTEAPN